VNGSLSPLHPFTPSPVYPPRNPRFDSIPRRCDNTLAPENQDARMHEQTAQVLLTLYSQAAALKLLPRTG